MKNPWEEISLNDYESHMRLDTVRQLQTMNQFMSDQFSRYPVHSAMVLGIAGGNGLEHVDTGKYVKVYGVDINANYLEECVRRFPELNNVFVPVCCDIQKETNTLPQADLVIANLVLEYIGLDSFQRVLEVAHPQHVSCVIQINIDEHFVSDSPYLHTFDRLEEILHQIDRDSLYSEMNDTQYTPVFEQIEELPNGKALLRLDFSK